MIFKKAQHIYGEYPGTFWVLMGAMFIDHLGAALLFPFFALYVTQHFGVGMTEVGWLFAIFAATSTVGSTLGGALADKLGRRWMIIFGLTVSGLSSLVMGWVDDLTLFYFLAAVVGLLADAGGPAQQAMVADLLPSNKQAEGFGVYRVVFNLTVVIGPVIGGFLAAQSYMWLFIADAVTSLVTAAAVYWLLPETKPQPVEGKAEETFTQTLAGYGRVLRDGVYMAFLAVSVLAIIVYIQMNSTLSVYLRDEHGLSTQQFSYILSLNAAMVVLFQFWVTRRISKYAPMLMLALGTALYGLGFVMYGFVTGLTWFMLAMVIITIGEMVVVPVGQALAVQFAPADMRGRYMAVFGFSWGLPFAIGPLLAGLIMDNYDPRWVWYACGIVAALAVVGYLALHLRVSHSLNKPAEGLPPVVPVYE